MCSSYWPGFPPWRPPGGSSSLRGDAVGLPRTDRRVRPQRDPSEPKPGGPLEPPLAKTRKTHSVQSCILTVGHQSLW